MPSIEATFGITKTQLGIFLTLNGVIYGVSRFVNGFIADRVSARKFMALGLALCALVNIGFGFSDKMALLITGLPQGVPAPHGIRQPDHLGAGRHQLLRLHRPLLDARLGHDAPARFEGRIGRRGGHHGSRLRVRGRQSGHGRRRLGHGPYLRQPRPPHLRVLYARRHHLHGDLLARPRHGLGMGTGHSLHADRLLHLRPAGWASRRPTRPPRRRRPAPTASWVSSVTPAR